MSVSLAGGVRHPKIYAYVIDAFQSTPNGLGGRPGAGLIKVGYTDRDVDVRIKEQLNTVKMRPAPRMTCFSREAAITDDGRHSWTTTCTER